MKKAFTRAAASARRKNRLDYGPSRVQTRFADPPEKKEDLVRETVTLKETYQTLRKQVGQRERQIAALQEQLHKAQAFSNETQENLNTSQRRLDGLKQKPESLPAAHAERLQQRRDRVATLKANLEQAGTQAKYYRALALQQQAYQAQSDFFSGNASRQVLNRHPTGEIFLTQKPVSMADEKPEVWDVGTSHANPYVCDSWPFEPNVLAQRTNHEAYVLKEISWPSVKVPMEPTTEETQSEVDKELEYQSEIAKELEYDDDDEEVDEDSFDEEDDEVDPTHTAGVI